MLGWQQHTSMVLLFGVAACVDTAGISAPDLEPSTRSVLWMARSDDSKPATGWLATRESYERDGLPPLIVREGERFPDVWLHFFDETLEVLGQEPGTVEFVDAGACGAEGIPVARARYALQDREGVFDFAGRAPEQTAPATHFAGPCPCDDEPELRIVSLPGTCDADMSFFGRGQVLAATQDGDRCEPRSGRTGGWALIDFESGRVTRNSEPQFFATSTFSIEEGVAYWGDLEGQLHRVSGDVTTELIYRPSFAAGAVESIVGARVQGQVELFAVITVPRDPEPNAPRKADRLVRFREGEGVISELLSPEPAPFGTRQLLVSLWLNDTRAVVFPEDARSWLDVGRNELQTYDWPLVAFAVRAGAVLPSGQAIVGTIDGSFLQLDGTDWTPMPEFAGSRTEPGDVDAIASVGEGEVWYHISAGRKFLGRRIGETVCPLIELSHTLKSAEMIARDGHVVLWGERTDAAGVDVLHFRRP